MSIVQFRFSYLLFCGRRTESAVAFCAYFVVESNSVFHKYSLNKSVAFVYADCFVFIGIVCQLAEYMSFVGRIEIIAVDNSHGIVELKSELKSQSASWDSI